MNVSNHPIWPILRLAVIMTALTIVLFITATKFDASELKVIIYMFLIAGSGEVTMSIVKSLFNREDRNDRPSN